MVTQKITHVRKVEHTSEIPSTIYWWTLKSPKNQTFGKMKKIAGDIIILHMCTKNHNHMRYSSWYTEWHKTFCHFGLFFTFLTPSPPNNPEHQNFEKMKKASGDVIILNLCNKKHDHIMHAYSDMECSRHNFLSFQAIFCSFATLLTLKVKIWKKNVKKHLEILSFYTCAPLIKIIWCIVPEIWSATEFFCHLRQSFALLHEKWKYQKWKKTLEISSFYTTAPKIMIICYTLPEKWCVTDVTVIFILDYTVKPVYNDHLQDEVSVVGIDRWSL